VEEKMNAIQEHQRNQAAYRQLSSQINQNYPVGRFVAIFEGQIVGDAGSFEDLWAFLRNNGKDPGRTLVVQAGIEYLEYPESAVIFLSESPQSTPERRNKETLACERTREEMYVRAKVNSTKPHPNPYEKGDVEVAWTLPVVP
jgi:hypothetical protein